MKQRVTRLVQSGEAVVNSAKTFYKTRVEHLQKQWRSQTNASIRRPNTIKWPGIPETRKLHQIGNTGGKVLYSCCCFGCIQGTMPCQNTVCPAEWTAFDLAKNEAVDSNLKNWFGEEIMNTRIRNMSATRMQHIDWSAILQSLAQQRSFVQLR